MHRIFGISLWLFCIGITLQPLAAQSLSEARQLYEKGEFEKAKPAMKRFVKSQPANGNYNLWYGVCCLETGQPQEALKYLQIAVKKRVTSGQLHLARCYDCLYRFEEAVDEIETYKSELEKRRKSTNLAEEELKRFQTHLRLMKGVEQVEVFDSIVVDKETFLSHYRLSDESGKLHTYAEFFGENGKSGGTVYETQIGNKIYFSEVQEDGRMALAGSNKQLDKWSTPTLLPGKINEAQHSNFPFVLSDGFTLFYASDGEDSMGGYDIFVTRYNTANDSYLTPENIGMPFNSPFNDYMYAIDEYNHIGWFVSDRYQPEGKVCIYLFIPNESKQVYDYDATDKATLRKLASLSSIQSTWIHPDKVQIALERFRENHKEKSMEQQEGDFLFVVNDERVYHRLEEFQSQTAAKLFQAYQQLQNAYSQQDQKLDSMRDRYANSNEEEKQRLAPALLDLEKRVEELLLLLDQKANEVRAEELKGKA